MRASVDDGFSIEELKRLNRVRLSQQVIWFSDILNAARRAAERNYLELWPRNQMKWGNAYRGPI